MCDSKKIEKNIQEQFIEYVGDGWYRKVDMERRQIDRKMNRIYRFKSNLNKMIYEKISDFAMKGKNILILLLK